MRGMGAAPEPGMPLLCVVAACDEARLVRVNAVSSGPALLDAISDAVTSGCCEMASDGCVASGDGAVAGSVTRGACSSAARATEVAKPACDVEAAG